MAVAPLDLAVRSRRRQLRGRHRELRELSSFIDGGDRATGSALFLLGAHGSGKTAMLDALSERTPIRLQRADGGVEALRTVISVVREPTALVIDGVDSLPPEDLRQLLWLSRRLAHRPVRLLVAASDSLGPEIAGTGVDTMRVGPVDDDDARAIIGDVAGFTPAGHVKDRVVAVARGNPRALRDLTSALDVDQLSGLGILPDPLPLNTPARGYWLAAHKVPHEGLVALGLAAAMPSPRLEWVAAAAENLGLALDVDGWEKRRLVEVSGDRVYFLHGTARSAIYYECPAAQRRQLHLALAEQLRYRDLADVRAWCRATVADEPNEDLAAQLCDTAEPARRRHGPGAAADVFHRAAELSARPDTAAPRYVQAAREAWQAGSRARAAWLLQSARPLPDHIETRAVAALVDGALALSGGSPCDAFEELIDGADSASTRDPLLALDLTARATGIAWWNGRADFAKRAAAIAFETEGESSYGHFVARMSDFGTMILNGVLEGVDVELTELLHTGETFDAPRQLIFASESAGVLGDDERARRYLQRAVRAMTVTDPHTDAAFALELLAYVGIWQGRRDAAESAAARGLRLGSSFGERTDGPFQLGMLAHLAGLRGDHDEAVRLADSARRGADGVEPATVLWALGRTALARCRFETALDHLTRVRNDESVNPLVALYATPDLVEAAAETGQWDVADKALREFEQWAGLGSPWARAVVPRLRALRAGGEESIEFLCAAASAPVQAARPFDEARTKLVTGRALRKARRRSDAREHLSAAVSGFEHLGLDGWAARAQQELRASGGSVRIPKPTSAALTDQEQTIAALIASGLSNRDAAARLHLSTRTVEYHLAKIYVKLGISSRTQLVQLAGAVSA